jgi:hypothetical protein
MLACDQRKKRPRRAFSANATVSPGRLLLASRLGRLLCGSSRLGSDLCLCLWRCGNRSRSSLQRSTLITQAIDFCIDLVFAFGQLRDACTDFRNRLCGLGDRRLLWSCFCNGLCCLGRSLHFCVHSSFWSRLLCSCHFQFPFYIAGADVAPAPYCLNISDGTHFCPRSSTANRKKRYISIAEAQYENHQEICHGCPSHCRNRRQCFGRRSEGVLPARSTPQLSRQLPRAAQRFRLDCSAAVSGSRRGCYRCRRKPAKRSATNVCVTVLYIASGNLRAAGSGILCTSRSAPGFAASTGLRLVFLQVGGAILSLHPKLPGRLATGLSNASVVRAEPNFPSRRMFFSR